MGNREFLRSLVAWMQEDGHWAAKDTRSADEVGGYLLHEGSLEAEFSFTENGGVDISVKRFTNWYTILDFTFTSAELTSGILDQLKTALLVAQSMQESER